MQDNVDISQARSRSCDQRPAGFHVKMVAVIAPAGVLVLALINLLLIKSAVIAQTSGVLLLLTTVLAVAVLYREAAARNGN